MIEKSNLTGIVLAGGKSSRMGTDKGFINLRGKAFAQASILALEPLVSKILIISGNPLYDMYKLKRIEDKIKDAGPLAGIYTGLSESGTDYNLVLSCDIPLIETEILQVLIKACDGQSDVVQLVSNGRPMPLIALYKKSCWTAFYDLLQKGERRLHMALAHCKVQTVVLEPEKEVYTANINTPEELKAIEYAVKD